MPFLGKQPSVGAYSKLDSITTSATTTFNLSLDGGAYYPQSANHLLVSLNGIIQAPQDSFTVSGSQIIFSSALTVSDSIDFIIALGDVLDIGTPTAGTVGTSQLANSAVTTAKIADDQITTSKILNNQITTAKIADDQITSAKLANAINITSGNSLTIDSGATITNNGTASGFTSTAVVKAYMTGNQSFTKDVYAKVNFNAEHVDSKGWYDTTTQRFTPLSAGFYFVSVNLVKQVAETQFNSVYTSIYKNGVNEQTFYVYGDYPYYQQQMMFSANTIVYLNGSTDYVEAWFKWGANGTLAVYSGGSFGQQSRLEIWRLDP